MKTMDSISPAQGTHACRYPQKSGGKGMLAGSQPGAAFRFHHYQAQGSRPHSANPLELDNRRRTPFPNKGNTWTSILGT